MLPILFFSALSSFLITVLLVRFKHLHTRFSADSDLKGIQKFHAVPVPRIGGLAMFAGLLVGSMVSYLLQGPTIGFELLLVSIPAFGAGLVEDLTKKVGAFARLVATFIAALLGVWFLHATLGRVDIRWVDLLLAQSGWLAVLFTMVAVGGVAHSVNIIDGYNGLSGMVSLFISPPWPMSRSRWVMGR